MPEWSVCPAVGALPRLITATRETYHPIGEKRAIETRAINWLKMAAL